MNKRTMSRRAVVAGVALLGVGTLLVQYAPFASASKPGATRPSALPAVRHVFVIMLENNGYAATFGSPTKDPYLAKTLPSKGALLKKYYGIGHYSNDNYAAFISGQPPNSDNQLDCLIFRVFQLPVRRRTDRRNPAGERMRLPCPGHDTVQSAHGEGVHLEGL